MPQTPLHEPLLAAQPQPMPPIQPFPSLQPVQPVQPAADHVVTIRDHADMSHVTVSPSASDLVNVSGAQVIAAHEHGQEIVVRYEDTPLLRLMLDVGLPFFNYCLSQTVKQWIEAETGPMENTSFGGYGNSIYDAAMPAGLTLIESYFLAAYFKTSKVVLEQSYATAGALAMGAALEGVGANSKLLNAMARPYASLIRAGMGTLFGWVTKSACNTVVELASAKKTVVASREEVQAEEQPVLTGHRLTTR